MEFLRNTKIQINWYLGKDGRTVAKYRDIFGEEQEFRFDLSSHYVPDEVKEVAKDKKRLLRKDANRKAREAKIFVEKLMSERKEVIS